MLLSPQAVLALAPDEASAKAARGLTQAAQWPTLGAHEAAVWGECQGSGSKPYQTQVDLGGPAFRCSCPSRKFPCKHGLALLLLRAQDASRFTATEPPSWVSEWLASRSEKAQKKEARQQEQAEKTGQAAPAAPADPGAAALREGQRWQRMAAGGQELQRWLADQLAAGLGSLSDERLRGWQTLAARLVDAQAPGLAFRVREAAAGVRQGTDWPERTLQRLGLLQLLCEALQRRERLPAPVQAELRSALGWPQDKAEVMARGDSVTDHWRVLGVALHARDDRLTERRVWLHGALSGRRALLLDHAYSGQGFESSWFCGQGWAGRLAFFPGSAGLRALPSAADVPPPQAQHSEWPTAAEEWQAWAQRVAACPWLSAQLLRLPGAIPLRHAGGWWIWAEGRALPMALGEDQAWQLLAHSGGQPLTIAGEWDGHVLAPLTAWPADDDELPCWQRSASA